MIGHAFLMLHLATAQLPGARLAEAPSAAREDAGMRDAGAPFSNRVPDEVLAVQRGGIRLPSGIDVALSIDTLTAVDGAIVLQTVTKIDEGGPLTRVFAPEEGQTVAAPHAAAMTSAQPVVTYDRQNGLQITTGGTMPALSISSRNGQAGQEIAAGLQQVDLAAPVETASGTLLARTGEGLQGVELRGVDINILHLTGGAYGSAIVNMGSDRAIDTFTELSVDLHNAGPDVLGSTMLRIESLAIEAMAARF